MWLSRRIISGLAVSEQLTEDYKWGIVHQDPLTTSLLLSASGFIIPYLCHVHSYTLFFLYLARVALECWKLKVSFHFLHSSIPHTGIYPPPPLLPAEWEAQLQACGETCTTVPQGQQMCNSAGVMKMHHERWSALPGLQKQQYHPLTSFKSCTSFPYQEVCSSHFCTDRKMQKAKAS